MVRIVWSIEALADLGRLEDFLFGKSPNAARAAIATVMSAVDQLKVFPLSGRPSGDLRELVVGFSNGGYIVRYLTANDSVTILAIRHQREAGR